MKRLAVYLTAPCKVEVREERLPSPASNQVVVEMLVSAINPGTELLFYRGQAPTDIPVDETIVALAGDARFPLKYGYSAVGRIIEIGDAVSDDWRGRLVFCFNPHESRFVAALTEVIPVPPALSPEEAACLPNMETAVNFLMDGQPLIGERVAVFGQGVVGLLTLNLGGRFHRSRIRLVSSQVSSIAPEWTGRWTKSRRLKVAWQMVERVRPAQFITHRFPVERAALAYALLDNHPEQVIQVLLTY